MEHKREKFNKEQKEQTPEEIRKILVEALCERKEVDLIVNGQFSPRMIIKEIRKNGEVEVSYIKDDGSLGEVITVRLSDITKAEISEE